jgi:hypothetical protein
VTLNIISIDPSTWMTESMAMTGRDQGCRRCCGCAPQAAVYSDPPPAQRRARLVSSKSTQPSGGDDAGRTAALASLQSPTLGDAAAKVHIVEFLDPACENCAAFYPRVKQLLAQNPGKIRLSLRHVALHEGSEYVVRLLEASRLQDKYWQTLETLLATQSQWTVHHKVYPERALQAVGSLGLDLERLQADMNSPQVVERAVRRSEACSFRSAHQVLRERVVRRQRRGVEVRVSRERV